MKKNEVSELFFSKTLDFLTSYLPTQLHKSQNTIRSYRDALTIFRRYITESLHATLRVFRFSDCTYETLLGFLEYLRSQGNSEATCNYRLNCTPESGHGILQLPCIIDSESATWTGKVHDIPTL